MATGLGRELAESQRQMEFPLTEIISRAQGHTLHLLGEVYKRCAHQQSVVQQLISLGSPAEIQGDILDLNAVLTELEAKFRKALGPGRSFSLKPQPGIPEIRVNQRELRESLLRLVADARHVLPQGGSIEISTTGFESADSRQGVQLAIRDTGKGIRAESKDRVFDPYYQSRPGNQNPGFSLALLYQFVTLHGGTIEVESGESAGKRGWRCYQEWRGLPAALPRRRRVRCRPEVHGAEAGGATTGLRASNSPPRTDPVSFISEVLRARPPSRLCGT